MCPGDMNWGKLLKIRRILVFSGTFTSFRKFFYCLLSLELVFHVIYESKFCLSTHGYFGCRTGVCDHTVDFVVFLNSTSQDHWETIQI